jgi:hypothetical protein
MEMILKNINLAFYVTFYRKKSIVQTSKNASQTQHGNEYIR